MDNLLFSRVSFSNTYCHQHFCNDQESGQSFALSVPKNKISLAKEMIRNFRSQFSKIMTEEPGDDVYHMNLHFFRLTQNPSKIVSKVDQGTGTALNKQVSQPNNGEMKYEN